MGLTVNRQRAKNLTINRQKRNIFYRQPSIEGANISRQVPQKIIHQELNDWWSRWSIRPAVTKVMRTLNRHS